MLLLCQRIIRLNIMIIIQNKSSSLWQYHRDDRHNTLTDSESFKSRIKITGKNTANSIVKGVEEIPVALKYLSTFWRTPEMPLTNCEINLILTWSSTCVITNSTAARTFVMTGISLYVPAIALSNQDNANLLQLLKSGFKKTINWNKYQSNASLYTNRKPYLDYLIDLSFQGVYRLFVLLFKNDADRTAYTGYYLPKAEIKDFQS